MTTVCYSNGVMAADTALWIGQRIVGHTNKITRLKDGRLVGCSGDAGTMQWFPQWLENGARKEDREAVGSNGFGAIVVDKDGEVTLYGDTLLPAKVKGEFHSLGAGCEFTDGAMAAGCDPAYAVQLALIHTDAAGGYVTVECLDTTTQEGDA